MCSPGGSGGGGRAVARSCARNKRQGGEEEKEMKGNGPDSALLFVWVFVGVARVVSFDAAERVLASVLGAQR